MKLKKHGKPINIDKLSFEDADALSQQIAEFASEVRDSAIKKANKVLALYGMKAEMAIIFNKLEEESPEIGLEKQS